MSNKEVTFQFVGRPVEVVEENIENTIKLIAGKLNNCNTIYYWNIDEDKDLSIGDYAIVENMNDYDLVKIVGVIETTEKYLRLITNCKQNKKVIEVIDRNDVRGD